MKPSLSHQDDPLRRNARSKIVYLIVLAVILTPAATNEVWSQPKCNIEKIAEDFVAKRFSSFDPAGTRLTVSETADFWEVTYQLPTGTLGGVPIVTSDKRTCAVVRAQHSQ